MVSLYGALFYGAGSGAMRPLKVLWAALGLMVLLTSFAAQARDLVIFGEPTLETALRRLGATWRERSGIRVNVFVAPSDLSFAQIERGARCDIIFALAGRVTQEAERRGIIKANTAKPIFRNALVLVESRDRPRVPANRSDPKSLVGERKLAIANPDRDLAGTYGSEWLRQIGIRQGDNNIVVAESSAGVATLIADNVAQVGIVYATDAARRPNLAIALPIAGESHPAIDYVVAEAMDSQADIKSFLEFLGSAEAKAIFAAAGLQSAGETRS